MVAETSNVETTQTEHSHLFLRFGSSLGSHESNTHLGGLKSEIVKLGFLLERILQSERIIERVRRTPSQPFIFQGPYCRFRGCVFEKSRIIFSRDSIEVSALMHSHGGMTEFCETCGQIRDKASHEAAERLQF